MSSNALTVHIQNENGLQEIEVAKFVNAARVATALARPVAPGFMRVAVPVEVKPDDTYQVGGGRVGLTARVYSAMAAAAGIKIIQTKIEHIDCNGEPGESATVWASRARPGMAALVRCRTVGSSYTDFIKRRRAKNANEEANLRFFMGRQLETAAVNRITRELLEEPASYTVDELKAGGGVFLVFTDVADPSDPMTREIMIKQSLGASLDLYGVPSGSETEALPKPVCVEVAEAHELGGGAASGEAGVPPQSAEWVDPFANTSANGDRSADSPAIESVDLPDWTKSCATDQLGEPRWDTIPAEQLKAAVRARLKELAYDFTADPAQLLQAGKDEKWAVVADKLLAFERNGGGANA